MKQKTPRDIRTLVTDALFILFGAAMYATGIVLFLEPNHMVPGGVGGLSVILSRFLGIQSGTLVFLINIPLFALAFWKFGARMVWRTVIAVALSSAFMDLLAPVGALTDDPLLAAFAGGALIAVGIGIIFRARATTGGTDILARLLKLKFPHVKTGIFILLADAVVISLSLLVFGELDRALYSALSVVLQTILFDQVLYGSDSAKLVYIVSDKQEDIIRLFLKELNVGVTSIPAKGTYTGKDRTVLLCAMHRKTLPHARAILRDVDDSAFFIVTPATQIFGEGFLRHDREEL